MKNIPVYAIAFIACHDISIVLQCGSQLLNVTFSFLSARCGGQALS